MRAPNRFRRIAPGLMCVAVIAACGLGDLLSGPRVGDVVLTYTGPTLLGVGDTIPVAVTVQVDGTAQPGARLWVTSSDTGVISVLPRRDSIAARDRGLATLTIRFVSTIFTDSVPTIDVEVRVSPLPLPSSPVPW